MSISQVSINGHDYTTYASVAEADIVLAVDPVRRTEWSTASEMDKEIYLIAATQRLDLLSWDGAKAGGASQAHAFPRSGLTYADGTAVPSDEVPADVERACILLAGSISGDEKHASAVTTSTASIERLKAGPVEIEYADGSSVETNSSGLQDQDVHQLVAHWITTSHVGSGTATGSVVSGVGAQSSFCDVSPYGLVDGYS